MAEISLRAYIKEIDDLIEHDQLDEAIAHCRHTLEFYPKLLATYRLLGKAYLEAKRYGDAADVFQRVLSAVPDDFVAQIGMAIVREDEGNLDSAIWHMERAFETNPANPAIQQELRRLIGNRDGIEPAKVRMTRAALARMYAHGELFPQAIAELKAALTEDPDRPDMQVLLAMLQWRTNQSMEAAEVSSQILEKLPYCRDANRIMAAILQDSNKTDEASTYHRRLAALDPYAAFIETANIDPQTIDANTVRIDKLEWRPGQPMPAAEPGQPEWAASLGVKLGDAEPEAEAPIPSSSSWLAELEKSSRPSASDSESVPSHPPAESAQEEQQAPAPEKDEDAVREQPAAGSSEIPEWMRDAGWVESSGEVQEQPISFTDEEMAALEAGQAPYQEPPSDESEEEGELAPAQIPGWMKEIAPSDAMEESEEPHAALPDWIGDIAADIEEVRPDPGEGPPPEEALSLEDIVEDFEFPELIDEEQSEEVVDTGSIPAWLDSEEPGATSTIITWLGKRSPEELAEEERRKEEARQRVQSEMPVVPPMEEAEDSLEALRELSAHEPEESEEGAPSWLAGVAEVAAQQAEEVFSAEELQPKEQVEEAAEVAPETELESQEEVLPAEQPAPAVEAPDWLQNIAAEGGPESADLTAEDWLDREMEAQAPTAEGPSTEEAAAADWLQSISEAGIGESLEMGAGAEVQPLDLGGQAEQADREQIRSGEESPEWLAESAAAEAERAIDRLTPSEEPADWLEGIAEGEGRESTEASPAAPDWLTGITEDEGEVDISPEELFPAARAPDWLQGIAEPAERRTPTDDQPDFGAPDWLGGISEPEGAELVRPGTDEATMDWLRDIAEEADEIPEPPVAEVFPDIPPEPAAAIASEELDDEDIFDWLQDLADRQAVTEVEGPAPAEGVKPTIIQEPEDRTGEQIISDAAIPEAPEEGLEWLESLASQRGIDHDVGIERVPHEPVLEESPEVEAPHEEVVEEELAQEASTWLGRMATQPLKDLLGEPEAELEPQLDIRAPDWLKEVAGEKEPEVPTEAAPEPERTPEEMLGEQPPSAELPEIEPAEIEALESLLPDEIPEEPEPIEMKVPDWLKATIEGAPATEDIEAVEPEEAIPDIEMAEPEVGTTAVVEPAVPDEHVERTIELPEPAPQPEAEVKAPIPTEMEEPEAVIELEPPIQPEIPEEEVSPVQPPAVQEPEAEMERPPQEFVPAVEEEPPAEKELPAAEPVAVEEEPLGEEEAPVPEPEIPPEVIELPVQEEQPEPVVQTVEESPPPAPEAEPSTLELEEIPPQALPEEEPTPEPVEEPIAAAPEPAPERAEVKPKRKKTKLDPAETLEFARQALATDDITEAVKHYSKLIKRGKELDKVIEDLRLAVERDEDMPTIWQILGDAYMKDDQLQEAIVAYKRGTEVA